MAEQPSGTVTLLFTDIEGSTALLRQLGTERYASVLHRHRELLHGAFARHDGYEVDVEGDAFFVAFPSAEGALAAAGEAQVALAHEGWPRGVELRVRMGVHTGEPVAVPPKYVGLDIHVAARVMAAAHGGQVLVSEATAGLGDTSLADLGEHRLKDIEQPVRLFQLVIPGVAQDFPPPRSLTRNRSNLPAPPNALVGRSADVAHVTALLRDSSVRLVTLTGVGGIGKTRLAIGAAAESVDAFADGVAFVALSTVMSHDNLLRAVATALHVREQPGEELIETLEGNLRRRELLLVLDNFEQIVNAGGLVAQLLERVPRLKVLVTSRVRLNVVAEHVVRVQPLAAPPASAHGDATLEYPAAQLLAQRVRASDRDRIFGDEALAQLGEIARRLDGIPLALELAAARLRVLGPAQLLARLDRRLEVLGEAPRDAEARQRTLAATLAWSVDLLPDDARRLFPALAVFPGGCSLEAVEAVAPDGIDPVSALETLLDASLVNRVDTFDEFRVTMYEPVREHAVASLRSSGGDRDARDRMLAYYAARMDGIAMLELDSGLDWSILVAQEEANIRAAIDWGIESGSVDATLLVFLGAWQSWRSLAEVGRWVDILLDRTRGLRSAVRFHVLRAAMTVAASRGAIETQTARAHEMLAIAETLDDVTVRVAGRLYAAWCLHATDPARARAYVDEAIRLAEDVGGDLLIQALGNRCEEALAGGDDRLAAGDAERMLEMADQMGASAARFVALTFLGWIALLAGQLDEARRLAEDANEQVARVFARGGYGGMRALSLLGHVHLHRGDDEVAAACLRTVVKARHERGMSAEVSFGLYALAAAYARADAERAIVLAAAAGDVSLCYSMGGEYQREVPYLRDRLAVLRSFPAAERARLEARGRRMTRDEAVVLALSPLRTANAAAPRREATTA